MEKSEKVHFRSCSALCNSSSSLTFALLSTLQQYLWEYILFVLLAPEVSSIRRLWSVNMAFNPIHLAHIVVTAQPSVQLSPFTKVSIHQLVTDSSFRKFNICKSYTSWLYFSPIIIIIMFAMCGYFFKKFFNKRTSFLAGSIEAKVEMTAPVTCHVKPGAGPACESQFTVSFYIPEEHQATPPEPNEPEVFIEHRKELTVYVR